MSYTSLYKVYKTKATRFADFSNAWGSAVPVWNYLCVRYLGEKDSWWLTHINGPEHHRLWDLVENPEVPECLRIAHAFTFDFAVIRPDDRDKAAAAFREVHAIIAGWDGWPADGVNHWNAIADAIQNVKLDKRCIGIGMNCTSVASTWNSRKDINMYDCIEGAKT